MSRRTIRYLIAAGACILAMGFLLAGCGGGGDESGQDAAEETASVQTEATNAENTEAADPTLLYMGHASLRIVTGEGKVIYIDPFAGDGYDLPADLILETHGHDDHTAQDLIKDRSGDCRVITWKEALADGSFDLGYVTVEATQAGNNPNHSIDECVGYILTFSNGRSVYVSGDTSTTDQMAELADKHIDYALFCCDGVYNMDLEEAAKCAETVQAKHNIPYHIVPADDPDHFDRERAEQFAAPNKMILEPGEEITIQ
ncbi:MAG: MBL fold metallo-hydrolase [Firmicutes bacterium]|nr:MBL fold metallo-hydrolase [Bacillota bacterium]